MKKKCACPSRLRWLLALVVLCWSTRALAHGGVLIIEVAEADEQPALRLADLLDVPSQRIRVPEASEPLRAQGLLVRTDAEKAVVFDSGARVVHVLARTGALRSRVVEGDPPAPYVMAFVATELLALHPAAHHEEPPEAGPPGPLARLAARVAIESNGAYRGQPMTRAVLGADAWLAGPKQRRYLGLIAFDLGLPGQVRVRREGTLLKLERWDTSLRAGLVVTSPRARLLVFAQGRLAIQDASYGESGLPDRRSVSLGLGGGAALELLATHWLSFVAGFSGEWLPRRTRYTVAGTPVLRERAFLPAGSLGVLFTTRFE